MKKVLIVSFLYYPSTAVGARRIYNFGRYLPDHDIHTTILTVHSQKYDESDPSLEAKRCGAHVERTTCFGPVKYLKRRAGERGIRSLKRKGLEALRLLARKTLFPDECIGWLPFAFLKGRELHRKHHYDLILSSGRPWTNFIVGDLLARSLRIPHVLDYRDPWTAYDQLVQPAGWMKGLSRWYERSLLSRVAHIIVNTPPVRDMFRQAFGADAAAKISVVENGYDPELMQELPTSKATVEGRDEKFLRLTHTGLFYGGRRIGALLEAIDELRRAGLLAKHNFELVSYGPLMSDDRKLVIKHGLSELVKEREFLSYQESLSAISTSTMNLLVVGSDHGPMIPAKLYDYLMVERPIFCLGPAESEARGIFEQYRCGTYCHIDSVPEIRQGLEQALTTLAADQPVSGFRAPAEFSIVERVNRLASVLHSCVEHG